jgi:L-seryl-tRNA(Ser) seleniumtransferase
MRALRVDKLTLASLEATLIEHAAGRAHKTIPVTRMMKTDPKQTEHRAESLVRRFDGLPGLTTEIRHTSAKIGGGSTPDITLPSRAISIHVDTKSTSSIEQLLRANTPPIIGRIDHDELLLDLLTVDPKDDEIIVAAVTRLVTS